jgi:hypothetical protein
VGVIDMSGPDLSLVSAAADFSTVVNAVVAVGSAGAGLQLAVTGYRMVMDAIHGGEDERYWSKSDRERGYRD